MGLGAQGSDPKKEIEVATLALLQLYPIPLRTWGMRITVVADGVTWILTKGLVDDDKSNNNNFQSEVAGGSYRQMADYDASVNTFPAAPLGSGTGGAIMRGNCFDISVGGVLGGEAVGAGATIRARVNNPGQVLANWRIYP